MKLEEKLTRQKECDRLRREREITEEREARFYKRNPVYSIICVRKEIILKVFFPSVKELSKYFMPLLVLWFSMEKLGQLLRHAL